MSLKVPPAGFRNVRTFPFVKPMDATSFKNPGLNCAWLNRLYADALNCSPRLSVKLNFLETEKSQSLMACPLSVFRATFDLAKSPRRMYCALGLIALYATTAPAELVNAVTPVPVPGAPAGLKTARSPALSPFPLASVADWTVIHCAVW